MIKKTIRPVYRFIRRGVHQARDIVLRSEPIYRQFLKLRWRVKFPPQSLPNYPITQGVLKAEHQWQQAFEQVRALALPRHPDAPKNWDTLAAVAQVLSETTPQARVLDAGAELYSSFLPALYAYGYKNLTGINLLFPRAIQRGPIRYEPGDITSTRFAEASFDAVGCLSVIEHGVDLNAFFREMSRIIRPNGLLIVSTDFWETPVDTIGKQDFGAPIHVFTRRELESALLIASDSGFELTAPIDLNCVEKAARWDYHGLKYTYVLLSLRRNEKARSPRFAAKPQAAVIGS
jgi:SAM-dependent methyltransferase